MPELLPDADPVTMNHEHGASQATGSAARARLRRLQRALERFCALQDAGACTPSQHREVLAQASEYIVRELDVLEIELEQQMSLHGDEQNRYARLVHHYIATSMGSHRAAMRSLAGSARAMDGEPVARRARALAIVMCVDLEQLTTYVEARGRCLQSIEHGAAVASQREGARNIRRVGSRGPAPSLMVTPGTTLARGVL